MSLLVNVSYLVHRLFGNNVPPDRYGSISNKTLCKVAEKHIKWGFRAASDAVASGVPDRPLETRLWKYFRVELPRPHPPGQVRRPDRRLGLR